MIKYLAPTSPAPGAPKPAPAPAPATQVPNVPSPITATPEQVPSYINLTLHLLQVKSSQLLFVHSVHQKTIKQIYPEFSMCVHDSKQITNFPNHSMCCICCTDDTGQELIDLLPPVLADCPAA